MDDVAERIVTVGGAADGLPVTVAEFGSFANLPNGLLTFDQAVTTICDDISRIVNHGRSCISKLSEIDPISEDLAIEVVGTLEKHHWMLHSQLEQ